MSDNTATFTQADNTLAFILAGNARFTVESAKTGVRYTFRVSAAKDAKEGQSLWFVSLLTGSDNESDYTYMGIVRGDGDRFSFMTTKKSRFTMGSTPAVAFNWTFQALIAGRMPTGVEVSHEGRCGRCGRTLTVPSSIAAGIGPECAEKMAA